MKDKYDIGVEVIFHSKHGKSNRTGQKAKIVFYGNIADDSGIAHGIEFTDGHQI